MKITLIASVLIIAANFGFPAQAQQTISLAKLMQRVDSVWPTTKNSVINDEILDYQIKNAKNTWKPELQLQGMATYQSSTIELNLSFPMGDLDIPTPDKDQYKVYFEARQMLYDGGTVKAQTAYLRQKSENTALVLQADINKTKKLVAESYFALLEIHQNEKILYQTTEDLKSRIRTLTTAVENGIAGEIELEKLKIQEIKLGQTQYEVKKAKYALSKSLEILLQTEIDTSQELAIPEVQTTNEQLSQTLIYKQMENTIKELKAQQNILKSSRNPRIAAFVQGGYGKPGLNMLSNEFQPYYIAGINAQWKIWDFSYRNNMALLEMQEKSIENNSGAYLQSLKAQEEKLLSTIERFDYMIGQDQEIMERQANVLKITGIQLEKGSISSADYLQELFAHAQSKLNLELHKIQKIKAIADNNMFNDLYQF